MTRNYHMNPESYSIDRLKKDLQSRILIPSRKLLLEGSIEKFEILEEAGNRNLHDLIETLKNKNKVESLALSTGIDINYLTLLRREVNSYFPNPVPLEKFSMIDADGLRMLRELGIKNSRHLFETIENDDDINLLSNKTGISTDTLSELLGLVDLVRAYGVGPAFARILYDTGIHSITDLIEFLPQQVVDLYESQTKKKADFSASDIQFSQNIIKALDLGG